VVPDPTLNFNKTPKNKTNKEKNNFSALCLRSGTSEQSESIANLCLPGEEWMLGEMFCHPQEEIVHVCHRVNFPSFPKT
jgi:hypothetical protein